MADALTPDLRRSDVLEERLTLRTATHVATALALALLIGWNGLFAGWLAGRAQLGDFGKFYQSAVAWRAGADLYWSDDAHTAPRAWNGHANLNPPHATLLVLPLTVFPPLAALAAWAIISVLCLVASLIVIKRELGIRSDVAQLRTTALLLLAFVGTTAVLATGQSAWVLMLPMTLAWKWARADRGTIAGIALGACLSVKPFLLVFLPYFLLRRQWGAFWAAISTAVVCFAAGLSLFGLSAHQSWLQALGSAEWAGHHMNGSLFGALSRAFDASSDFAPLYYLGPDWVRGLWLLGSLAVGLTTLVATVQGGQGRDSVDYAFALLILAALVISPLGWVYYLWLPAGPVAARYLARHDEPRERASKMLFWAASVGLMWPLGAAMVAQPNALATITIGSVYFWALISLWCGVAWGRDSFRFSS